MVGAERLSAHAMISIDGHAAAATLLQVQRLPIPTLIDTKPGYPLMHGRAAHWGTQGSTQMHPEPG